MVTTMKLSKDLNNTSLEELISYLRNHEIMLEQDDTQIKRTYVALNSLRISKKTQALQVETDEDFEEVYEEEDELSLLSRRINQLWKKKKRKFRGKRRTSGHSESTYGSKKVGVGKQLTCFECKEPGHFKNECPKLKKERPKKKFRGKKKGLMDTCDDSSLQKMIMKKRRHTWR